MLKKVLLLLLLASASFAWWDASFPYRTQANISSPAELSDYQVNISLNTQALIAAGKMRTDCADLRIVASNDSAQLPYWIESGCNATSTKIWVKVPSVPNGTSTFYAYYGNASAAKASNGTDTFLFFDDFSGNLSKWQTPIGSPAIVSGRLRIVGSTAWNLNAITTTTKHYAPLIIEWKEENDMLCCIIVSL